MEPFVEESALIALLISAVLLGSVTIVGLVISILQAATQIQDQTLSTVPKLMTIIILLFIFGGWMFEQLERIFLNSCRALSLYGPPGGAG